MARSETAARCSGSQQLEGSATAAIRAIHGPRTALLLALIAASTRALTDNFVDGQCATADGEDHFPYKSEAGDQFTDVISADYSLLWEVQYENDYKIVKNTKTGDVHVLHQCGLKPPSNEELPAYAKDGTLVEVPLTKIATTSTTYLAFLEMLGERKALKSYQSSFQYVSSPCLRKMHRDGLIEEKDAFADPPKYLISTRLWGCRRRSRRASVRGPRRTGWRHRRE